MGDLVGDALARFKYNRFENTTTPKSQKRSSARAVVKKAKKPITLRGAETKAPRYDIKLDFSDNDGDSFDSPLVVAGGQVIQLRMTFTQRQDFPLLQGLLMRWSHPSGWLWSDGHGSDTYEVCVSNPLVVTRLLRVPSATQFQVPFKATSVEVFQTAADSGSPELPILRGTAVITTIGGDT